MAIQVPQAMIRALSDRKNVSTCSLMLNRWELACWYSTPSPRRKTETVSPFDNARFASLNAFQLVSPLLVERIMPNFISRYLQDTLFDNPETNDGSTRRFASKR